MRHAILTTILLAAPRAALACPVCFGQSDSPLAQAINMGVIMMLGVVVAVLGGFAAFFISLNRRAKQYEEATRFDPPFSTLPVSGANPHQGPVRC